MKNFRVNLTEGRQTRQHKGGTFICISLPSKIDLVAFFPPKYVRQSLRKKRNVRHSRLSAENSANSWALGTIMPISAMRLKNGYTCRIPNVQMNCIGNLVKYFLCFTKAETSRANIARVMKDPSTMNGIHSGGCLFFKISLNDGTASVMSLESIGVQIHDLIVILYS